MADELPVMVRVKNKLDGVDVEAEVPESSVPIHEAAGWKRVDAPAKANPASTQSANSAGQKEN